MTKCRFVTNHATVLSVISRHGQMPARDIAVQLEIGVRTVHRVVSELEAEGYIERASGKTPSGYQVHLWLPLRRRGLRHIAVERLLRVLEH